MRAGRAGPVLPAHWGLTLDVGLRRTDAGQVLIGGYPVRILRLSPTGARTVDDWAAGGPVGKAAATQNLARRLVDAGMAHPAPTAGTAGATTARGPNPTVSLVVPTRDRPAALARLLNTALGQGFSGPRPPGSGWPVPVEVIVVDDGSAEPAAVAVVAERFGARLLRHPRPLGPAAARNRGWRSAEGELVAFLDDDCRCPDGAGWMEALTPIFQDPSVALVAPRVQSTRGRAPGWLAAYESAHSPLDRGPTPAPVRPASPVPFVPAAALIARRTALEAAGGFDESLPVGEDVDLVWRLAEAGWSARYVPEAVITHEVRPELASWLAQRFRYGSSAVPLDRRHPGAVAPVRLSGWTALAWALVGTGAPPGVVAGVAVGAGTTAFLVPRLSGLEHPLTEAVRLTGRGQLWVGRRILDALRREWWPVLVAGLLTRRGRRVGLVVLLAAVLDSRRSRPAGVSRLRWLGLALADDTAYGAGLWSAALSSRRFGALAPRLSSSPHSAQMTPPGSAQTTLST